jgi:hypothetical protein
VSTLNYWRNCSLTTTARVQREQAQWRQPKHRECQRSVSGTRVPLHLFDDHGFPRMVDYPGHWISLLWSFETQVSVGYVVPGPSCSRSVSCSLPDIGELADFLRVCFQWMFWGYSLAYSRTASPFIGDMANFGLKNVMSAPSPGSALLPEIVFCLYQMLFCVCTVMLVIGGSFERGRILPSMIFAFCWATIVYCPIACWTWNVSELYIPLSIFTAF